jgi:hypothetical protein
MRSQAMQDGKWRLRLAAEHYIAHRVEHQGSEHLQRHPIRHVSSMSALDLVSWLSHISRFNEMICRGY